MIHSQNRKGACIFFFKTKRHHIFIKSFGGKVNSQRAHPLREREREFILMHSRPSSYTHQPRDPTWVLAVRWPPHVQSWHKTSHRTQTAITVTLPETFQIWVKPIIGTSNCLFTPKAKRIFYPHKFTGASVLGYIWEQHFFPPIHSQPWRRYPPLRVFTCCESTRDKGQRRTTRRRLGFKISSGGAHIFWLWQSNNII